MGYGPDQLELLQRLYGEVFVDAGRTVAELGAQQLGCKGAEGRIAAFIKSFNPRFAAGEEELRRLCDQGLAGQVFRYAGFQYDSFDVNDKLATVVFDLNTDSVRPEHRHGYDLVTNFGTTEHVFNQFNAFRVMHDLTRPGGYMWHSVPMGGMVDHSLFSYHPKFFYNLAMNNFYEIVDTWIWASEEVKRVPDYHANVRGADRFRSSDALIQVVYRRTGSLPFLPAIDHLEDDADGHTLRFMLDNIFRRFFSEQYLTQNNDALEQYIDLLMQNHGHGGDGAGRDPARGAS